MHKHFPGPSNFWRRRFGFAVLATAVLAAVLPPAIARAHGSLVRSEPVDGALLDQSPSRVTAWFNQELEAPPSTIAVFDALGRQIDSGKGGVDLDDPDHASLTATLANALDAGRYTVRWSVVSATDGHSGHATSGEFVFEIRQP